MKTIPVRTAPSLIIGLLALLFMFIIVPFSFFKVVPAAVNNTIIVALEEPVDGGTSSGVSNLRGWAVAPVEIVKVEWMLDGGAPQIIPYGGTRPDVQSQFPSHPHARESGFSRAINFSNLEAGQHTLTVRATDRNGDTQQVTHTFHVVRFDNPFIADPADVSLEGATSTLTGGGTLFIENMLADGKRYHVRLDWSPVAQGFAITDITSLEPPLPPGGGTPANRNPSITSAPPTTGTAGQPYVYTVTAADPDGDRLSYLFNTAPTGMTIDARTGLINWVPGAAGDYLVSVQVNDGRGGADVQIYHVLISDATGGGTPANRNPSITSAPPTAGQAGQPYTYQVTAADPDGDGLSYTLTTAPVGMTIDAANGLISWIPGAAGTYAVTVQVSDGRGGTGTQSYQVLISGGGTPANRNPSITSAPPTTGTTGQPYLYTVTAIDPDGDGLSYTLTTAPVGMTVSTTTGLISWIPGAAGTYAVTIQASDGRGGTDTQSYQVLISDTGPSCCRVCIAGKACGDTCIERTDTCHQPRGCACDG